MSEIRWKVGKPKQMGFCSRISKIGKGRNKITLLKGEEEKIWHRPCHDDFSLIKQTILELSLEVGMFHWGSSNLLLITRFRT